MQQRSGHIPASVGGMQQRATGGVQYGYGGGSIPGATSSTPGGMIYGGQSHPPTSDASAYMPYGAGAAGYRPAAAPAAAYSMPAAAASPYSLGASAPPPAASTPVPSSPASLYQPSPSSVVSPSTAALSSPSPYARPVTAHVPSSPSSSGGMRSSIPPGSSVSSSSSSSSYTGAPLSLSTSHVKREPYPVPTWEQKEREFREQQQQQQQQAQQQQQQQHHPAYSHQASHYQQQQQHHHQHQQPPQQQPAPGKCSPLHLHGAFATRGDAFKRLALVASALDSPTPAFDAEEWETASKSKCAAINNKTEAATKRFVSLLQAEMDYGGHPEDTILILQLQCADLQHEIWAERQREHRLAASAAAAHHGGGFSAMSPYGSASESSSYSPVVPSSPYGHPTSSSSASQQPSSSSPYPSFQHPSHPAYGPSSSSMPGGGAYATVNGPPATMSPAHLPPHHPSPSTNYSYPHSAYYQ
ncbi:uncharacterized protein ACA1_287650 [Acanthamoeba castellanii str. Neff]|uniref:Uncharacterized protein n=1 Tax=Acanthamoeba castellanii (strain ATCC 30010 / Neff) TaxID=1257118 RepID=L8HL15_ACACF|nr:uncharacterized protein ACA1_287650 [Acanthamoeba castellanii str. Neff]ELR25066.1 hypothetical protein ACA1_287650 [Acanthamoeba castellanii str. Neff]